MNRKGSAGPDSCIAFSPAVVQSWHIRRTSAKSIEVDLPGVIATVLNRVSMVPHVTSVAIPARSCTADGQRNETVALISLPDARASPGEFPPHIFGVVAIIVDDNAPQFRSVASLRRSDRFACQCHDRCDFWQGQTLTEDLGGHEASRASNDELHDEYECRCVILQDD